VAAQPSAGNRLMKWSTSKIGFDEMVYQQDCLHHTLQCVLLCLHALRPEERKGHLPKAHA
jgi:hypothetical protein